VARRSSLYGLFILIVAACATVQHEQSPVVPGLSLQVDRPAGPDTILYQRSITRAGQDSIAGTRTVVLQVVRSLDHSDVLQVVQRFPGGGGEIVDTAVAALPTMRAVAHRSHQPTRIMRFTFDGSDAQGTVIALRPAGDSVTPVQQSLGGPIFDSNVIDLVVAALPLRPGFATELPFFIYERGGRVAMPVAVRERSTVTFARLGPRDVWIVSVGVPGAPATVWVDTRTRAVLRVRYDIAARALSFTDERITPLHG
jgi:hypothetical protein